MFQDEKTLNTIHAKLGCSVSSGSLKTCDIIPVFLEVIRDTPEYVQLLDVIPCYTQDDNDAEWWSSEDAEAIQSQLFDVLNSYAITLAHIPAMELILDFGKQRRINRI